MSAVCLGLVFPGEQRAQARRAAAALVLRTRVPGSPWSTIWGRDPDREDQEEREGVEDAALAEAAAAAEAGHGAFYMLEVALPGLGRLPATVEVWEGTENEVLLSFDEEALFPHFEEDAVVAVLLGLAASLVAEHGSGFGFLGREATVRDLAPLHAADAPPERLDVFEFAFWPLSGARLPVSAGTHRFDGLVVRVSDRSLTGEEVAPALPPALRPA